MTERITRKRNLLVALKTLLIAASALASTSVFAQRSAQDTVTLADLKKISRADMDKVSISEKVAEIRLTDASEILAKRAVFTEYLRYLERLEKGDANDQLPDDKLFTKVEIEAVYPGGLDAWQLYIKNNLRYPTIAMERKIQGVVVVMMIVDVDGTTSDLQAVAGPSELRQQAIELVKASGKWLPAIQNKRVVRSYKKMPVVFALGGKAYSQQTRVNEYSKLAIFSTNQNATAWKPLPLRNDGAPDESLSFSSSRSTSDF